MAIKDLAPKQGKVDLIAEVLEVSEAREFEKFGKSGRVASATIKDTTGSAKLSLWNDEIDKVKAGDKIQITNGYVNEFRGELQITAGKFGKLEVLDDAEDMLKEESEDEAVESEVLSNTEEKDPVEDPVTEDEKTEGNLIDNTETDEGSHILTDDEKTEEDALFEEGEDKEIDESEVSDDEAAEEDIEVEEDEIK